jgi:hypothetical protein
MRAPLRPANNNWDGASAKEMLLLLTSSNAKTGDAAIMATCAMIKADAMAAAVVEGDEQRGLTLLEDFSACNAHVLVFVTVVNDG